MGSEQPTFVIHSNDSDEAAQRRLKAWNNLSRREQDDYYQSWFSNLGRLKEGINEVHSRGARRIRCFMFRYKEDASELFLSFSDQKKLFNSDVVFTAEVNKGSMVYSYTCTHYAVIEQKLTPLIPTYVAPLRPVQVLDFLKQVLDTGNPFPTMSIEALRAYQINTHQVRGL